MKRTMLALLTMAPLVFGTPAAAREYVDLELVIATDVSQSIDSGEARLQREGVAAAFRSREVIEAISAGTLSRIAVAYLDYSSRHYNKVVVDWHIIGDATSADAFAQKLLDAPLTFGRRTSITNALQHGVELIETNDIEGTRMAIDVAGDGPNNFGGLVDATRDEVIAKRITINGLPIINDRGGIGSRYNLPDLDDYYRGCVIGGPGAFLVVAGDFQDFARAIRRKLILEIAGIVPPTPAPKARFMRASMLAQAQRPSVPVRPSPTGYTYERGCDIGERLRDSYWVDEN